MFGTHSKPRQTEGIPSSVSAMPLAKAVSRKTLAPGKDHPIPPYHHYHHSKTQSEQLLDCLTSLGYEASKGVKAEHFDYVFNNAKSAEVAKSLMATAMPECVLSADEIERYESLKHQGLILYGADLEKAVAIKKVMESKNFENARQETLKRQELERLIALRKAEVADLANQHKMMRKIAEKKKQIAESKKIIDSQAQRESKDLDIQIQVSQRRLMDKLATFESIKSKIVSAYYSQMDYENICGFQIMADWNLKDFVDREVKINNEIQELIAVQVPNLIIASEGYNEDRSFNEVEIREIVENHMENLERLRHSLIYEKKRNFKLECKLVQEDTSYSMLPVCFEKATKSSRTGVDMTKLETNLDEKIATLEATVREDRIEVRNQIRDGVLKQVNRRFNLLIENKNRAKKRLNQFMLEIFEALERQKVRMDIVRHLMTRQIGHFADVQVAILNFDRRMAALNFSTQASFATSVLNHEGRVLFEIFQQLDYPLEVFQSAATTLKALTAVNQNVFQQDAKSSNNKISEHFEKVKSLLHKLQQMQTQNRRLQQAAIPCEEIQKIQLDIQNKEQQLAKTQEDCQYVQKSLSEKKDLLQEMDAVLKASFKNNYL